MKFRVQTCFVLLLIAIVAATALAQKSAEKDPRASQEASLHVVERSWSLTPVVSNEA